MDSHLVLLHIGYSTGVVSGGDVEMRPETQGDLCPVLNLLLEAQAGEGAWQWLIAHVVISMFP